MVQARLLAIIHAMVGTTVGHYQMQERLGEGGMGVVYKARDVLLNRTVALKFLPVDTADADDKRAIASSRKRSQPPR